MDEEAWPGWRTDRQLMCKPHLLPAPVTTCISQDVCSATAPGGTSRLTPGKHTHPSTPLAAPRAEPGLDPGILELKVSRPTCTHLLLHVEALEITVSML